jgi:hypothetical protein
MSDYLEAAIINHLFRGSAFSAPTTLYAALYTVAPTDAGGGTEVSAAGYARVAITCNTSNWSAPGTNGTTSNSNAITFPAAGANWGNIVAIVFFDAASGGNMLIWLTMTSTAVNNGQTASFASGALSVTAA